MTNRMRAPKIKNIEITDPLFGSYARLVADAILPYQWEILNNRIEDAEKSYCVENFRIAAGEIQGEHHGAVFCDTDAYKWIEAVSYCIENGTGESFIPTADELIALIGRAQQPDGYLDTYFTIAHPELRWKNLCEGHELYSAGHLIEAAVAYYNATGKDALLNIAKRYVDLICEVFGPDENQCKGYSGHPEIELALVKLYKTTREQRYLELAKHFINQRGQQPPYLVVERHAWGKDGILPEFANYEANYAQSHLPLREQTTAEGHAVRAMYMYCAMADIARECGDAELKSACLALWNNIVSRRMYITGGLGSSGWLERFTVDYDLPNDSTYCETCASIGLMMFGSRMTALTRDASYYDIVERALCNTVLAGISITGDRYFYVNPLEVWPNNLVPNTSMEHVKPVRQRWFSVACCPTNISRTLASLGCYIYAEDDKSIYINQFISSRFSTRVQDTDVSVEMRSTYMRDGKVVVVVNASQAKPFTIRVRVPSYASSPSFMLGDTPISPVIENGYAVLAVSRSGEQTFEMSFSVPPVFLTASREVRADLGKLALMKGPFVYCLEQTDNGDNLACVRVCADAEVTEGEPVAGMPGELPTLSYSAKRVTRTVAEEGALYGTPDFEQQSVELKAVPYCFWCNREPGEMLVWQKAQI